MSHPVVMNNLQHVARKHQYCHLIRSNHLCITTNSNITSKRYNNLVCAASFNLEMHKSPLGKHLQIHLNLWTFGATSPCYLRATEAGETLSASASDDDTNFVIGGTPRPLCRYPYTPICSHYATMQQLTYTNLLCMCGTCPPSGPQYKVV